MQKPLKITIFGAGAMGTTLAAWMTASGHSVSLIARGDNARQLKQKSVRILSGGEVLLGATAVEIVDHISAANDADLFIIAVKNFDLEHCSAEIIRHISKITLVLALQNGIVNQTILPKYFSNIIYAISNYNAWREPSESGADQNSLDWNVNINGPIILGTLGNDLQSAVSDIKSIFSEFMDCQHSLRFLDDVYAKMVSNLSNSVTTIIGNSHLQRSALVPLQYVLTEITYEGMLTLRAAGMRPPSKNSLPPWWVIKLGRFLPGVFTRSIFQRKLALIGSTSMAGDILGKNTGRSELESINGAILALADRCNVDVPYNQRLYHLCKVKFAQTPFEPISATELKNILAENPDRASSR